MKKSKILILGHKEHGKTTLARLIGEMSNLTFVDSSMMAAKIFIFNTLKGKYGYRDIEECYIDRRNHREEWYNLICEYNKEDKSALAKEIMKTSDMYVGMRSDSELQQCKKEKIFDIIVGIFDPSKPLEGKNSMTVDIFKESDFIILAKENESELRKSVKTLIKGII